MKDELEIRVYGRVQGVNLRRAVAKWGQHAGINGCVLNRADGSLEIVAQGSKEQLQELLHWIQGSPGISCVRSLQYQWRKPSQTFEGFTIVRDSSFLIDQAKSFLNLSKSLLQRKYPIPIHIAIIPDGNRRWARQKGLAPQFGHYTSASFQHLISLFNEAQQSGVHYLTLWGFSTENWKRNSTEIKAIFDLILRNVEHFREEAHARKIRFRHLGRKDRLPAKLLRALTELEEDTHHYDNFNVQLCLDYGGRDEIIRAVNKLLVTKVKHVDETAFAAQLDSVDIPAVDLIIRTSGEQRLSGFMPFQSAYAELYFADVHFPDFDARELRKALNDYGKRQRRFGGS